MRLLNVNLAERTLGPGKILFHHVKDLGLLDALHAKYGYDFIGPYNRRREITDRRDKNLDGREGNIERYSKPHLIEKKKRPRAASNASS
jgi:hypothetical protein